MFSNIWLKKSIFILLLLASVGVRPSLANKGETLLNYYY